MLQLFNLFVGVSLHLWRALLPYFSTEKSIFAIYIRE